MLYVTTRSDTDCYPDSRVLRRSCCGDGGLYVPYRGFRFTWDDLVQMGTQSPNETIACILNAMFRTNLTGWDVDFCVGRYPVRTKALGNRIYLGECWHNPDKDYDRLVKGLLYLIHDRTTVDPAGWPVIGVQIAVLFALVTDLIGNGVLPRGKTVDVSVVSGDFTSPVSAWYARSWGLPVGNIVCCCIESSELWNLFVHGQLRTDAICPGSAVPSADVSVPFNLERLIFACGGREAVQTYLDARRTGGMYVPAPGLLDKLRSGMYVSVVSSSRIADTVPAVYRTHGCRISDHSALAYSGLLDYRARTASARMGLILGLVRPEENADPVKFGESFRNI